MPRSLLWSAVMLTLLAIPTLADGQWDLDSCVTPDTAIDDLSTVTDTQAVVDDYTIGELEVFLDISHTFIGSLEVTLTTPDSTDVRLIKNVGYTGDDALVTFSDFGPPHDDWLGCDCVMRPRGPQNLSDAVGESTAGDWTLTIEDTRAGDTGTLNEWCVRVNEAVPVYPILDLHGVATDVEGVCELNWTHPVGYDEIDVLINGELEETLEGPFDAGDENSYVTPALVVPQEPAVICLIPRVGDTDGPESCVSVQLPELLGVLACNAAPMEVEGTTAFEYIDLSSSFEIDLDSRIQELEVLVEATVPFNAWRLDLESPQGTIVQLHDGSIRGTDIRTTYTDEGLESLSSPLAASARMQPTGPGFLADFIGETIDGSWNLRVRTYSNGRLDNWCLNIKDCPIEAPEDLSCVVDGSNVELSWLNASTYDEIDVYMNGDLVESIPGSDTGYTHSDVPMGRRRYHIIGHADGLDCFLPSEDCVAAVGIREVCDSTEQDVTWWYNGLQIDVAETDTIGSYFDAHVNLDVLDFESDRWDLRLTSPSGTTVLLHDNEEGSYDFDVYFADGGMPNDGSNGRLSRGHLVTPSGPGSMSDFEGENVSGIWSLDIETRYDGTLAEWCVGWAPSCEDDEPTAPTCVVVDYQVTMTWTNPKTYDSIDILRDNAVIASLDGNAVEFVDDPLAGVHAYRVVGWDEDCALSSTDCTLEIGLVEICDETDVESTFDVPEVVTITVGEELTVQDLEFAVAFERRIDAATLTSPDGTTVTLVRDRHYVDCSFTDHADPALMELRETLDCGGCPVNPAPGEALSAFRGVQAEGDWELEFVSTNGAVLQSLCLRLFEECELVAPSGLTCVENEDGVLVEWTAGDEYDEIQIYRVQNDLDKEIQIAGDLSPEDRIAELDGAETSYTDSDVAPGHYRYFVRVLSDEKACGNVSRECRVIAGRVDACDLPGTLAAGDGTPVDFTVSFPEDEELVIADTEVFVDVTTTFTDAAIDIESPNGTVVALHRYEGGLTSFDVTYGDGGRAAQQVMNFDCGGCIVEPTQGSLADFTAEIADGEWLMSFTSFYDSTINEWCVGVFAETDEEPTFTRGDVTGDGTVSALLDALALLEYGFDGGETPPCLDAADVDDDGTVFFLLDALFLLEWMFVGGDVPPDPAPGECGVDPTVDDVSCESSTCTP